MYNLVLLDSLGVGGGKEAWHKNFSYGICFNYTIGGSFFLLYVLLDLCKPSRGDCFFRENMVKFLYQN